METPAASSCSKANGRPDSVPERQRTSGLGVLVPPRHRRKDAPFALRKHIFRLGVSHANLPRLMQLECGVCRTERASRCRVVHELPDPRFYESAAALLLPY